MVLTEFHSNPVSPSTAAEGPICATVVVSSLGNLLPRSDRAALSWLISQKNTVNYACCPPHDQTALSFIRGAGIQEVLSPDAIPAGLVICGQGGGPFSDELFLAKLAIQLRAEWVLEVLQFAWQGQHLEIVRDLGRGEREKLQLPLSLVLGISSQAANLKYISRYRRATAVPAAKVDSGSPLIAGSDKPDWQPLRQRPKTSQLAGKIAGSAQARMENAFGIASLAKHQVENSSEPLIQGTPQECATHLVRYLAHAGILEPRRFGSISDLPQPPTQQTESLAAAPALTAPPNVSDALPTRFDRRPRLLTGVASPRYPQPYPND